MGLHPQLGCFLVLKHGDLMLLLPITVKKEEKEEKKLVSRFFFQGIKIPLHCVDFCLITNRKCCDRRQTLAAFCMLLFDEFFNWPKNSKAFSMLVRRLLLFSNWRNLTQGSVQFVVPVVVVTAWLLKHCLQLLLWIMITLLLNSLQPLATATSAGN